MTQIILIFADKSRKSVKIRNISVIGVLKSGENTRQFVVLRRKSAEKVAITRKKTRITRKKTRITRKQTRILIIQVRITRKKTRILRKKSPIFGSNLRLMPNMQPFAA